MPRKLHVSATLSLPLDYATETGAVVAKKGAGKTYTASVQAEEFLKCGIQIAIVDPTGAWWGLRASEDGKSDGYPIVIFGGDHGDLPLNDTSGALVARTVMESGISAVIDLDALSQAAQRRIVQEFCETLYQHNRHVIHLFIDEADAFVPQRIWKGQERCFKAVDDVVRRGRKKGIGTTLISQRTAAINKDVLTQAETLFVLRTTHPRDLAPIEEWVRAHDVDDTAKTMMADLPTLSNGEAFVWSPEVLQVFKRVKIRQRETFNSSATPKVGERLRRPKRLAPVDLERLRDQFSQAVEKARHDDPKLLREALAAMTNKYEHLGREYDGMKRHLADVERRMQEQAAAPRPPKVVVREVPVLTELQLKRLEAAATSIHKAGVHVMNASERFDRPFKDVVDRVERLKAPAAPLPAAPPAPPPPRPTATPSRAPPALPIAEGDERLRPGEVKMLQACAALDSVGGATPEQIAVMAGMSLSGGTFRTYFPNLKAHGFIQADGSKFRITGAGRARIDPSVEAPTTFEGLRALWAKALRPGENKILDALVAAYPHPLTPDQVAERSAMTVAGGTYRTYVPNLKRQGLIEAVDDGLRATENLFVFGGPRRA